MPFAVAAVVFAVAQLGLKAWFPDYQVEMEVGAAVAAEGGGPAADGEEDVKE